MKTRITRLMVAKDDYPEMYETGFIVTIYDEGGGEFVKIENGEFCSLNIGPDEWPELRRAINKLIKECKE